MRNKNLNRILKIVKETNKNKNDRKNAEKNKTERPRRSKSIFR